MSIHNLENELASFLGGKRITFGATVPTAATAGYPFGAIFIHTDGASGDDAVYINTGSSTSCSFTSLASVAASDFGASGMKADVVAESTSAAGVTVDGVLVKDGGLTIADGSNIILNTTTGTKIGTATGQKIGFFNATPVAQRSALTAANASTIDGTYGAEEAAVLANIRTRLGEVEAALETLGLVAAN